MNFDHLQLSALSAVIREGSFERAAAVLHVTPSAISQRIRALEEKTGTILVVRESPCRPTAEGEKLYRHALQIELLEDDILQTMKIDHEAASRPIPIAVNIDSLSTWFPEVIRDFAAMTGQHLEIITDDQDYTAQWLREGRVLGAITSLQKPIQGCQVYKLGTMHYDAVASPDFVRRYFGKGVNIETLSSAPVIFGTQKDALPEQFIKILTGKKPGKRPPYHCIPCFTILSAGAIQGLGWAPVVDLIARPAIQKKQLINIAPGKTVAVNLYWQCWRLASPSLDALTKRVQQAARNYLAQT